MIKKYTTKLFYHKFPYHVKLSEKFPKFVKKNAKILKNTVAQSCRDMVQQRSMDHRFYTTIYADNPNQKDIQADLNVYLNSRIDYDTLCTAFYKDILSISEPFNSTHEEWLRQYQTVSIRNQLVYGKYRYVITMNIGSWPVDVDNNPINQFKVWLIDNFTEYTNGVEYLCQIDAWVTKLYLINQSDVTYVKIAMDEYITSSITVKLTSEMI